MKKLFATTILLIMLLGLCACDGGNGNNASTGSDLSWEEIEQKADEMIAGQED